MSRYVFAGLFLFTVAVSGMGSVRAQDYTTGASNTAQSVSKTNTEKCTQQDIAEIKKFDSKAKRYVNKINKHVGETSSECGTKKLNSGSGVKGYGRQMQSAFEFFQSEEYKQMEKVYLRCGRKIPAPKQLPGSYWFPDENVFGDDLETGKPCD